MLTIGEFSKICEVTAKTLRYYEEIGLLAPVKINAENGYRYYALGQLETMLFINRLKAYGFSLEEIKEILQWQEPKEEKLYLALTNKKRQMNQQIQRVSQTLRQMEEDLERLNQGKSMMSYMEDIGVQLTEVQEMCLLSIRRMVQKEDFPGQYGECFGKLLKRIAKEQLTIAASPMVLFHSDEFSIAGLDTEFAIPIKETVSGTRMFAPGLCLKTVLKGTYRKLSSVYVRQREWAQQEGYQNTDAVFEMYITDPSLVVSEEELVTEIFCPVKKVT